MNCRIISVRCVSSGTPYRIKPVCRLRGGLAVTIRPSGNSTAGFLLPWALRLVIVVNDGHGGEYCAAWLAGKAACISCSVAAQQQQSDVAARPCCTRRLLLCHHIASG